MTISFKQFIFVCYLHSAHTLKTNSFAPGAKKVVSPELNWTLSETSGQCQRGPEGAFVTFALLLLSWQADSSIREVSQGESLNGSCAYEEQMH